jgi:hypothetical protein
VLTAAVRQQVILNTLTGAFTAHNVNTITSRSPFALGDDQVLLGRVGAQFQTSSRASSRPPRRRRPTSPATRSRPSRCEGALSRRTTGRVAGRLGTPRPRWTRSSSRRHRGCRRCRELSDSDTRSPPARSCACAWIRVSPLGPTRDSSRTAAATRPTKVSEGPTASLAQALIAKSA